MHKFKVGDEVTIKSRPGMFESGEAKIVRCVSSLPIAYDVEFLTSGNCWLVHEDLIEDKPKDV